MELVLALLPTLQCRENFRAVFLHLLVGHSGLLAELGALLDVFFHRAFIDKLAIGIAPLTIIFINTAIFFSRVHIF